jgi:hypothetical protein
MTYLIGNNADQIPGGPATGTKLRQQPHCAICLRRVGQDITYLEETGEVPEPRQSWVLCGECSRAVQAELERSPVVGPLRVRVAVGIVAAERSPRAIRRIRAGMSDDGWLMFLVWGFAIVMVLHLFVIAWIAYLIR